MDTGHHAPGTNIGFIVAFVVVSIALRLSGIDVAIARGLVTSRMTYSRSRW